MFAKCKGCNCEFFEHQLRDGLCIDCLARKVKRQPIPWPDGSKSWPSKYDDNFPDAQKPWGKQRRPLGPMEVDRQKDKDSYSKC